MAKGRIEQEIALKVTGLDDVQKAESTVDKLGKKKTTTLDVEVDSKSAKRDLDQLFDLTDKLGKTSANLVLKDNAKDIKRNIADLLIELDQLDASDPTIDAKIENINQLEGDLEKIQGKIKEVNATPVDVDTSKVKSGFDDVGRSVEQAQSVSANAIGNMTQDFGELGGVAGSAGVAIGQFGEYFADALNAGDESIGKIAKNFISVAGPLTAATIGVGLFTQAFQDMQAAAAETKAFNKERVESFTDALHDAKLEAGELKEALETGGETSGIFIRLSDQTHNVERSVAKLFGTFQNFNDEVAKGTAGYDQWSAAVLDNAERASKSKEAVDQLRTALADARDGTMDVTQTLVGLSPAYRTIVEAALAYGSAIRDSGKGAEQAAFDNRFYGEELVNAADANDQATNAIDANARAYVDQAAGIRKSMAATEEATAIQKEFARVMSSTEWKQADLDGAVSGMQKFHDQFFGLINIASDYESALDNLGESLKENGKTYDVNTEKGRANLEAVEQLASAVDTELAGALAGGKTSFGEFSAKAGEVANTLRDRLIKELGLSGKQADEVIAKLGLMPADVQTRYTLSGTEQAMQQLQLLDGTIDRLPKNVQAVIDYKISMGDYAGAVQTAQNYANRHPVTIPVELRVDYSNLPAGAARNLKYGEQGMASAPWPGAIAGEAGPEFIRRPGRPEELLMGPAVVPPGTRVTSVKRTREILTRGNRHPRMMASGGIAPAVATVPVTVNVNAAVIGSRYEVAKAVGQATRDLRRVVGRRGAGVP